MTHLQKAPLDRGRTGQGVESQPQLATESAEHQVPITGGTYSRRAEWIHDGLADLELSGVSCLLRAPAGGEARSILRNLPNPLTIRPLQELVAPIRHSLIFSRWDEIARTLTDEWHEQLRCYSRGPKCRFTEHERAAHEALVALLTAEGGRLPCP
jgi:hypothetical protein